MKNKNKFNKRILRETTILYLENDEIVRKETLNIFEMIFLDVIVAKDVNEAYTLFQEKKDDIDIILADINMPDTSSLAFISQVREIDFHIPIIVLTDVSNTKSMLKVIKYNITNYLFKPIVLESIVNIISQIMENIIIKKKIDKQAYELKQFMSILDSKNLICEMDTDLNISHVNEFYTTCSDYSVNEIKGKKFIQVNEFKKNDPKAKEIMSVIKRGKPWTGDLKKISKEGDMFYTNSTIVPIFKNEGSIKKYIEFATLTTKYESERYQLRQHILKLKSSSFQARIELKNENIYNNKVVKELKERIEDTVTHSQEVLMELYELKNKNNSLKSKNIYLEMKLREQEKRFELFQKENI